jgi:NAD(P)-dependent dehydrogenase (short-subunit alcohol dehydrogenase family)
MALSLFSAGHWVVAVDVDAGGLDRLTGERGWADEPNVLVRTLDVRNAAGWEDLVGAVVARFGRIDTLLNVAGFLRPGYVHEMDTALLDLHVDVMNLFPKIAGLVLGRVERQGRATQERRRRVVES